MDEKSLKERVANGDIEKIALTKRITIEGDSKIYSVYKIPLNYLYYNDQNGRINTAYRRVIADEGKLEPSVGETDYNKQFEKLIFESDKKALKDTENSIKKNGQQEPGVVLNDGRVIDGNRRLTAIRRIQRESGNTEYFEAAILNLEVGRRVDEKKIKQLELDLQLGREERKNYDPIDRIFDVYDTVKVQRLLTINEYKTASGAGNTKGINRDLRLADLIIRFLQIVSPKKGMDESMDEKFYLARDLKLDGPIEEIEGVLTKLEDNKNAITDNVLTTLAVQIANSDNGDRDTTRKMRDIKTHILKNPDIKANYIKATDENADVVMEYFDDNPIESSNDLKQNIQNDATVVEAANRLVSSTNRLVRRGKEKSVRQQSLTQLENIRDNLSEISPDDFLDLRADELGKVDEVLKNIQDLLYKLRSERK